MALVRSVNVPLELPARSIEAGLKLAVIYKGEELFSVAIPVCEGHVYKSTGKIPGWMVDAVLCLIGNLVWRLGVGGEFERRKQ